ncbi:MAG: hemerythrin domain-containing protein [Candidatus Sulfotelmatobacter sp.]
MLRDKNLIPLSHQHQRGLALCVRIDRAQPIPDADLQSWQKEIEWLFENEIDAHFTIEEDVLFPVARRLSEVLNLLVDDLIAEHVLLRELFFQAKTRRMSAIEVRDFGQKLSAHIRKEERLLFEDMQRLMNPQELSTLGVRLESALKGATQSCFLPNEATKLKAQR